MLSVNEVYMNVYLLGISTWECEVQTKVVHHNPHYQILRVTYYIFHQISKSYIQDTES